jgi:hypothetical protein
MDCQIYHHHGFLLLLSDGAKYITGTKTAIDGGWTTFR